MRQNILDTDAQVKNSVNFLWVWNNQPPVMQWWFAISGVSIMAVYFILLANI